MPRLDAVRARRPKRLPTVLAPAEVAAAPINAMGPDGVERWRVDPRERRIILFRVPIQRLSKLHRNDELHQRMLVESCVFRAVAELLGKDPWDLAPERFRHF